MVRRSTPVNVQANDVEKGATCVHILIAQLHALNLFNLDEDLDDGIPRQGYPKNGRVWVQGTNGTGFDKIQTDDPSHIPRPLPNPAVI